MGRYDTKTKECEQEGARKKLSFREDFGQTAGKKSAPRSSEFRKGKAAEFIEGFRMVEPVEVVQEQEKSWNGKEKLQGKEKELLPEAGA